MHPLSQDAGNRKRLMPLLRFQSSKSEALTTLDDYISRMKEGQKNIYFLIGAGSCTWHFTAPLPPVRNRICFWQHGPVSRPRHPIPSAHMR